MPNRDMYLDIASMFFGEVKQEEERDLVEIKETIQRLVLSWTKS